MMPVNKARSVVQNLLLSLHAREFSVKLNLERYQWLIQPAIIFLISRVIVFGAAHVGNVMFATDPGHWSPSPDHPYLELWARWDSQWYNWIIEQGYWLKPGQQSNVAFFPLYPLIVSLISPFLGKSVLLASIFVSNAAFFGALVFLYLLTELEFGDAKTAQRAVFYLAIFPTSFFFSAMYTESLFLMMTLGAVYFARRHEWAWAAVLGFLAAATRVVGVLAWGVAMWEWLRVQGWTLDRMHKREAWVNLFKGLWKNWFQVAVLAIMPLGLLSYMAFLQLNFHDPMAFVTVQSAWARQNVGPIAIVAREMRLLLAEDFNIGNTSRLMNLLTLFSGLGISLVAWKRLGAGYGLYALMTLIFPSSSSAQSIIRYMLVCFPVFMMLGAWGKHAWLDRVLTVGFAVLLGIMTALYVNWFFVA